MDISKLRDPQPDEARVKDPNVSGRQPGLRWVSGLVAAWRLPVGPPLAVCWNGWAYCDCWLVLLLDAQVSPAALLASNRSCVRTCCAAGLMPCIPPRLPPFPPCSG